MIILGIDPGYAILGYGVISTEGIRSKVIDYGVIETVAHTPFPQRLERLYTCMNELIKLYKPDHVAFEELFFARNTKTALQVAAARGVALLSAQQAGLPMQIKSAVTGNGHADKKQVQQMIKLLLSLNSIPKPDDAADALAAALCHANTSGPAAETFRIK